MIRVLFIARYRQTTMERKPDLLARDSQLDVRNIRPQVWQDEYGYVDLTKIATVGKSVNIPMWGKTSDPHRALYRTLDFTLRGFQPDLIHAEEEPDSLSALQIVFARRLFAPHAKLILYTWQNIDRPRSLPVRWVMRNTLDAADAILCASKQAAQILERKRYHGKVRVLPAIGVDTRFFTPRESRASQAPLVVGYVGRLAKEKGIAILIHALALVRNVRLILVGEGPFRGELQKTAIDERVTEQIEFRPPAPPEEIARSMREMDVLVLPSRTNRAWKEQFGRVLIEAMASRVPVVGSNSGAIPEVIGDAGLLFPEGDVHALAGLLEQLRDSPDQRRELAQRGYERAIRLYSQEHIAAETSQFYRQVMGNRPR